MLARNSLGFDCDLGEVPVLLSFELIDFVHEGWDLGQALLDGQRYQVGAEAFCELGSLGDRGVATYRAVNSDDDDLMHVRRGGDRELRQ